MAPDDGVFFDDCYTLQYGYCHGVYFGNKNNTQFETVVNILSQPSIFKNGVQYCGDHGDVIAKFDITCSPSKNLFHIVGIFQLREKTFMDCSTSVSVAFPAQKFRVVIENLN